MPFDLFGEIPVTWPEVLAWCECVAGIPADSWRLEYYVRGWNVIEKIRAAKAAGTLEAILEAAPDVRSPWRGAIAEAIPAPRRARAARSRAR